MTIIDNQNTSHDEKEQSINSAGFMLDRLFEMEDQHGDANPGYSGTESARRISYMFNQIVEALYVDDISEDDDNLDLQALQL